MRTPIEGITGIEDLFTELTKLIADDKGKVYWCMIEYDAMVTFDIKKHFFNLKMPLPRIRKHGFASEYYKEKYNEEEIKRMRKIWEDFLQTFKEKLEKVNTGQTTIAEEFADRISIDEKYGLVYKGKLVRIDEHTVTIRREE